MIGFCERNLLLHVAWQKKKKLASGRIKSPINVAGLIPVKLVPISCVFMNRDKREFEHHVYGKRQTSDSSWEFLKIENEQIKTAQNNSYG